MLPNWSASLTKWFDDENQLKNVVLFPAFRAAVKLSIGNLSYNTIIDVKNIDHTNYTMVYNLLIIHDPF